MANAASLDIEIVKLAEYMESELKNPAENDTVEFEDIADRLSYVAARAERLRDAARAAEAALGDI